MRLSLPSVTIAASSNTKSSKASPRSKGSMGWIFGFKLHIVVNKQGELLAIYLTAANRHELKALPKLVKRLFGDRAYLSQSLFEQLLQHGIHLITKLKFHMKNKLMVMSDKLL